MSVLKHTMLALDYAAAQWNDPEINMAVCLHDTGKRVSYEDYGNTLEHEIKGVPAVKEFCEQWKVPNTYRDLAVLVCQHHTRVHGCLGRSSNDWMRPKSIFKLMEETSALKRPERFVKILKCCEADSKGRGLETSSNYNETQNYFLSKSYPQRQYLEECLQAVLALDTKAISKEMLEKGKSGVIIGQAIREARIGEIRKVQNMWKNKLKEK